MATEPDQSVFEFRFTGVDPPARVRILGLSPDQANGLARLWETRLHLTVDGTQNAQVRVTEVTRSSQAHDPVPHRSRRRTAHPVHRVTHAEDQIRFPTGLVRLSGGSPVVHVEWFPDRGRHSGPSLDLMETAMGLALGQLGVTCLHAVAFQSGRNTVLGVGGSGAGKSTIAAAAIRSGGQVASDDSVLTRISNGRIQVGPFRGYFSFRDATLHVLPSFLSRQTTEDVGSHFLDRRACPDLLANLLVPNHVWHLKIDRRLRTSRIRPVPQQQTLIALMSSASLLTLSPRYPRARAQALSVLTAIAEGCRGFDVRLGNDLLDQPESTLQRLCDEGRAPKSLTPRL